MNAVEVEEALTLLFEKPFDPEEFPYEFLRAFGNKDTTIKRLQKGSTNKSDLPGGLLQRRNIHLLICEPGEVAKGLELLRESPATAKHKVRFLLATDGVTVEADALGPGEYIPCDFHEFPEHFAYFLPLAGIEIIDDIKDNILDIRATNRLRRLYTNLFEANPEWAAGDRREEMNLFMTRLIFCFFAEDTQIFGGDSRFSRTIQEMSKPDGSNVHEILGTLFEAMNTPNTPEDRAHLPRWAARFPYVNGGLFASKLEIPHFTRTARSYLIELGRLTWTEINPDIFGSMIQVIATPS